MERMKSSGENLQTRDQIEAEIAEIEEKQREIQAQIKEVLAVEFQGDPNNFEMRGIFEERRDYELRRLSDQDYELNAKRSGLEYKLSQMW